MLILGYSCAYVSDILVQGSIYISPNWFCFHSKILGFKTEVSWAIACWSNCGHSMLISSSFQVQIPVSEVLNITRERTALFIPNAIGVLTKQDKVRTRPQLLPCVLFVTKNWDSARCLLRVSHSERSKTLYAYINRNCRATRFACMSRSALVRAKLLNITWSLCRNQRLVVATLFESCNEALCFWIEFETAHVTCIHTVRVRFKRNALTLYESSNCNFDLGGSKSCKLPAQKQQCCIKRCVSQLRSKLNREYDAIWFVLGFAVLAQQHWSAVRTNHFSCLAVRLRVVDVARQHVQTASNSVEVARANLGMLKSLWLDDILPKSCLRYIPCPLVSASGKS